MQASEEEFIFKCLVCIAVGALLGMSLFSFWKYEDCIEKGVIELSDKTFYCAEKYSDTINLEIKE